MTLVDADGTFEASGGESAQTQGLWTASKALVVACIVAVLTVFVVAQYSTSEQLEVNPTVLFVKDRHQRLQSLGWGGFTLEMQEEADKALRACDVGYVLFASPFPAPFPRPWLT